MLYQSVPYLLHQEPNQAVSQLLWWYKQHDSCSGVVVIRVNFANVGFYVHWVSNTANCILCSLLLFSLSHSLLHCLDQLICFCFLCSCFSLIASACADCFVANCILAQHAHWFVYSFCIFVLLSTHLHVVLLLFRSVYICSHLATYWYSVCWCSALFLSDEYGCVFGEEWVDGSLR